ncbi:MAG: hypothetical protein H7338_10090 [Candidatus Sericytochromatia bacterium]|nr:hypothetical protein [Candidatus Sericytochromatia bacterium]
MKKSLMSLVLIAFTAGCTGDLLSLARLAAAGGANAKPGATASPGANPAPGAAAADNASMSNAELDGLMACANTKGETGKAVARGWVSFKALPENSRGYLVEAIVYQAKIIGCR